MLEYLCWFSRFWELAAATRRLWKYRWWFSKSVLAVAPLQRGQFPMTIHCHHCHHNHIQRHQVQRRGHRRRGCLLQLSAGQTRLPPLDALHLTVEETAATLAKLVTEYLSGLFSDDTNSYKDSLDVDKLLEREHHQKRLLYFALWEGQKELATLWLLPLLHRAHRKGVRARLLGSLTLRICRRFAVDRALSPELYHLDCGSILRELLVLKNLVEKMACEFEAILMRYDATQSGLCEVLRTVRKRTFCICWFDIY